MKILDRYIINEMLGPFLFGVATFTVLFFAGGQLYVITRMIAESKTSLNTAMVYMVNSLPAILVFTFPMAVLLAALLAFGRLSGESELIAIKAGGTGFLRVASPAIILSFFIAFVALYINNNLAPNSTYTAQNILIDQFTKNDEHISENMIIKDTQEGMERTIFSRRFIPRESRMEDVTIQYFKDGHRVREVFANKVFYRSDDGKWYLKEAYITDFNKEQEPQYFSSNKEIYLPLDKNPSQLAQQRSRRPEEMDRKMLKDQLVQMEKDGFGSDEDLRRFNEYEVYYHQKIAIPFTCFVFGLFGVPLGVRPQRTSKALGLGISIIFIFVYYVLMSMGMAFGRKGDVDPFIAAWIPNILFGIAGVVLIARQARQ